MHPPLSLLGGPKGTDILYIDLEEQNILILLCESTDLRDHLLARSAVGCIEINENWTGGYELCECFRIVCAISVRIHTATTCSIQGYITHLSILDTIPRLEVSGGI